MRLLLDTHVALWAIADSRALPARARALLLDPTNEVYASAASIWEIAIKHGLDRGAMPISAPDALSCFRQAGFHFLAITPEHAARVEALPPYHRDPFDRILVAQALTEPLRLVTHDRVIASYDASILSV